jgi:hypothetical protein
MFNPIASALLRKAISTQKSVFNVNSVCMTADKGGLK